MSGKCPLVEKAIAGDTTALQQLLLRNYAVVQAHIAGKLPPDVRSMIGSEDILQQVFVAAFRDLRSCRAGFDESFLAWLKAIADHRLADTVRALNRKKRGGDFHRLGQDDAESGSVADLVEMLADSGITPSGALAKDEAKQALEVALAELPDDYRRAVRLYYLDGQNVADVAKELRRTPGAVRGILARARDRLHELLGRASHYLSSR